MAEVSGRTATSRWHVLVVVAIMATIVVAWWRSYGAFQVGAYEDDAKYVLLARALVAGQPFNFQIGPAPPIPTDYPFVFPLLLTPFVELGSDNLDPMTLVSLMATLANVLLIFCGWRWLSRGGGSDWALGVSALYGLAPLTLGHVGMVMSEAVFLTWVLSALWLTEWIVERRPQAVAPYLGVGLLLALAQFTRVVGSAVVAAVVLRLLFARCLNGRGASGVVLGGVLLLLPVIGLTSVTLWDLVPDIYLRGMRTPSARFEVAETDPLTRVTRGLEGYGGAELRAALVPLGGGAREEAMWRRLGLAGFARAGDVVLVGLVLIGALLVRASDRLRPAPFLFEVLMLLMLLLWPYRTSRFLYPLLPFLFYHLARGVELVARLAVSAVDRRRAPGVATAAAVITILTLSIVPSLRYLTQAGIPSTQFAPDFRSAAKLVRASTPPDAVVFAEDWPSVALYAKRAIVAIRGSNSVETLSALSRRYAVDHVLLTPERMWRLDGPRQYSAEAQRTLVPYVHELEQRGAATLVRQGDPPDRARLYRINPAMGPAGQK